MVKILFYLNILFFISSTYAEEDSIYFPTSVNIHEINQNILEETYDNKLGLYEWDILYFNQYKISTYSALICGRAADSTNTKYWILARYYKKPLAHQEANRKWLLDWIHNGHHKEKAFRIIKDHMNIDYVKEFLSFWDNEDGYIFKREIFSDVWLHCVGENSLLKENKP